MQENPSTPINSDPQISNLPSSSPSAANGSSSSYAWITERILANCIDSLIFFPVTIILLVLSALSKNFLLIYLFPLFLFTYQFLMISKSGQTVGKKFAKIKVVQNDGQTPSSKTAFMREIVGRIVESIGPLSLVTIIMVLVSDKKQSMHDAIAHTVVMKTPDNHNTQGKIITLVLLSVVGTIVLVFLVPMLFIGFVAVQKMHTAPLPSPDLLQQSAIPQQPISSPALNQLINSTSNFGGAFTSSTYGYSFAYPNTFQLKELSSAQEELQSSDGSVRIGVIAQPMSQFNSLAQATDAVIAALRKSNPTAIISGKAPTTVMIYGGQTVPAYTFIINVGQGKTGRERLVTFFANPDQTYFIAWELSAPFVTFNDNRPASEDILKSFKF